MESEKTLSTLEEYNDYIKSNIGAVAYFSTPECNVCKVLKPKLKNYLNEKFPELKFAYIDVSVAKELAAQNSIFAVPTILFYFEGREFLRKSRNINFFELDNELTRLYTLIFD